MAYHVMDEANRLMNSTEGLKANDRGLIATDEVGRTSVPGLFASGDVVKIGS